MLAILVCECLRHWFSAHALLWQTGRITALDELLKRNSQSFADLQLRRPLIAQALLIAQHYKTDQL